MEPTGMMIGLRRDTHEVWCLGQMCMHWLQPEEVVELGRRLDNNQETRCPVGELLTPDQVATIRARYRQSFVKNTDRTGNSGRPSKPQPCPKCGEACRSRGEAEAHCRKKRKKKGKDGGSNVDGHGSGDVGGGSPGGDGSGSHQTWDQLAVSSGLLRGPGDV